MPPKKLTKAERGAKHRKAILDLCRKEPTITPTQIAARINLDFQLTRYHLGRLMQDGSLRRHEPPATWEIV